MKGVDGETNALKLQHRVLVSDVDTNDNEVIKKYKQIMKKIIAEWKVLFVLAISNN